MHACQYCVVTERVLITTTQLAERRGVTRQAILAAVRRGRLVPLITLANGHYLFGDEAPKVTSA